MGDIVIRVASLGKCYRIGSKHQYYTLRERLTEVFATPFQRFGRKPDPEPAGSNNNSFWALKNLSFEVHRGEVVGIIGRNGAGKSTLLKILSRITYPTEGKFEIRGRVVSLLEVGTGFHPELTGRENIYLNGAILGMKKVEIARKFDEIVAFAEVERFIDTPVKHYSSGMYVRLAFAVAAHLEPEILLVDEVLAVGDALFQKKCIGKMGDVAKQGRTVLFVSHNMSAINILTRRCLLLKDGHLEKDGEPISVTATYLAEGSSQGQGGIIELRADLVTRLSQNGQAGDIALARVELLNQQGFHTSQFYEGEPISIIVSFDVRKPIKVFQLGLAVNIMGVRVFMVKTGDCIWSAPPGNYKISTVFDPNYLSEGMYSITLGIHTQNWYSGDGYSDVAFEIIPNPAKPKIHSMGSGSPGLLDMGYVWSTPTPVARYES